MKNILVTGGAGFIGSNYIKYMNNVHPEYNIVNLDKIANDCNCENLRYVKDSTNYKFINGNISDRSFIFNLFEKEKFDVVVNFASEHDCYDNTEDKSEFIITNIIGTQALLDASKEYGVRRYHQVSTNDVYEDLESADEPCYIASKIASEKLVIAYEKEYNLKSTISRHGKVYDIESYCKSLDDIIHNGIPGEIYSI